MSRFEEPVVIRLSPVKPLPPPSGMKVINVGEIPSYIKQSDLSHSQETGDSADQSQFSLVSSQAPSLMSINESQGTTTTSYSAHSQYEEPSSEDTLPSHPPTPDMLFLV